MESAHGRHETFTDELALPYESFLERAEHETDPALASDLRLCATIAQEALDSGGQALELAGLPGTLCGPGILVNLWPLRI